MLNTYTKLSGFYFFYFALLGIMVPYWALYLQSFDFEAQTIGTLMAMLHVSRIFAPNLWGWLADRYGRRIEIVRFGALMTCIAFALIFWQTTVLGIGLVMLAFSFFWNAVLPQFEVITLTSLGKKSHYYSRIRLWGSIGFVATVLLVGRLLDFISLKWIPWMMLLAMVLIWLNALCVPSPTKKPKEQANDRADSFLEILLNPQVVAFFVICFFIQFGHGAYYTFYSVLMVDVGFSRTEVGVLWAIGVIAEIVLFIFMHQLLQRFGMRIIMLVSLSICVIRWALIGAFPDSLALMLFAQLMHAATFGALHSVGIALVNHYFTQATYGQGQALFSSVGFGLGGALGAFASGWLWDSVGAAFTFSVSSLVSIFALVIAIVFIYPEKVQKNNC